MSIGWLKDNKRGFRRRAFLRGGAGTVLSLPIFESLIPRESRALAALDMPRRLITYYVPNGHNMASWRPTTAGKTYTLTPNLMPLAAMQADFMVVTGLNNQPAVPDVVGDHAAGTSASFTAVHALKSTTMLKLGVSLDQIAAAQFGKLTRVPSIQLGMEDGKLVGGCDSGYGCAYSNSISWSTPTTAMPKIIKPQVAFDLLFMGGTAGAPVSQADVLKRKAYRQSVLDFVIGGTKSLATKLGRSDGRKLDEFLTGVQEVEREVNSATVMPVSCKPTAVSDVPAGQWDKLAQVFADIMVLAMQCDVTRVFSFMFANAVTGRTYPALGATRGHHDISHHGNIQANLDLLTKISTFEVQQLAYLMTKMKAVPEGNNDMLYNSTLVFTSDVSDGNRHNHDDMPVLVAGHGGGMLNTGQHIVYPNANKTKHGNMLTSALRTVGAMDLVGDGDNVLPEMLNI
ncbi:MAG TPA: DUF1552 domain-containing protein [Polyangia bacterium]|nr:DUF1552 domain-containing protein [Polyangia bacterium]